MGLDGKRWQTLGWIARNNGNSKRCFLLKGLYLVGVRDSKLLAIHFNSLQSFHTVAALPFSFPETSLNYVFSCRQSPQTVLRAFVELGTTLDIILSQDVHIKLSIPWLFLEAFPWSKALKMTHVRSQIVLDSAHEVSLLTYQRDHFLSPALHSLNHKPCFERHKAHPIQPNNWFM